MIRQWKRRWQRWSQWWCKRWWQWCHQKWWHRLVFTQWFCCSWFFCISVYLYFELQWGGGHPHQLGCIGLHLNRPESCYDYSIIIVYLYFLVFVFLYLVIFIGCIWTVQNYVTFSPSSLCIFFLVFVFLIMSPCIDELLYFLFLCFLQTYVTIIPSSPWIFLYLLFWICHETAKCKINTLSSILHHNDQRLSRCIDDRERYVRDVASSEGLNL